MIFLRKSIYICSICLLLFNSCTTQHDADELAATFCACGEPLAKWKKELDFHYEKLSEGTAIKKKVEDCLASEKGKYNERKNDMEFRKQVAELVNESCPDLVQSLPALFTILYDGE
ncbi:MAG: hypothetical protein H7Y00_06880 [Fimbriimonadaceae bacterium]|nr:hypothetical protein [Chitinophagales bacterium]